MTMVSVTLTISDGGNGNSVSGGRSCNITTVQDTMLYCDVPEDLEPSNKYDVTVSYGSLLKKRVGTVSLTVSKELTELQIIVIIVSISVFLVICIIVVVVLRHKIKKSDQGMKKLRDKMDMLELTVAKECKEGK